MSSHTQSTLPGCSNTVRKTDLYESLPRLPIRECVSRDELIRRLARLCDDVLPMLATREDYPVAYDHCFRRIAYDVAVGGEWTETIDRPFVDNADMLDLSRAYRVAAWMVREGRPIVNTCNNHSLRRRGLDG